MGKTFRRLHWIVVVCNDAIHIPSRMQYVRAEMFEPSFISATMCNKLTGILSLKFFIFLWSEFIFIFYIYVWLLVIITTECQMPKSQETSTISDSLEQNNILTVVQLEWELGIGQSWETLFSHQFVSFI